ncbi:MAG: AMP-binding protein [Proteobacteria bacterium]|nr:AMP-binding protein [Pseudomonadota bacterium]MDA1356046.1 AMP-binding protein [Pseudomonadota bacterium]
MPNDGNDAVEQVADYSSFAAAFKLEDITDLLSGDLETGLNVCVECCDRWAESDSIALYWEGADGSSSTHSFAELQEGAARFANLLTAQGVRPGDHVACMLPRIPDLFVVALGVWRAGAVYVPLFTAFGPKAIEYRLERSGASLVVTDAVNRAKLDGIADAPPVMVVTREPEEAVRAGDIDFRQALAAQPTEFAPVMRTAEDPFIMMFTSGTVGSAKGVAVPLKALPGFLVYMKYAIGVGPEDRFWNMADPGWAYGLFYAVAGPMLLGYATHFYEGGFSVESTYKMLEKHSISIVASAPTAYRLLMAAGGDSADACRHSLRAICSAGEPLNPEVIRWIDQHLGCPVFDQYGQTETGMTVCNHHGLRHAMRPGSMGLAMPGFHMVVLNVDLEEVAPGESGMLAVDTTKSPLYTFQGYRDHKESPLKGPYYLTGDTAELGANGSLTFLGRADDIILSAGYRIGPFDVESCLIEHPAVAESAVIGKPDTDRGEIVVAFVVLGGGHNGSPELVEELQQYARTRLSAHAYPRQVIFLDALPKTPSGKIQRFVLRQQA